MKVVFALFALFAVAFAQDQDESVCTHFFLACRTTAALARALSVHSPGLSTSNPAEQC